MLAARERFRLLTMFRNHWPNQCQSTLPKYHDRLPRERLHLSAQEVLADAFDFVYDCTVDVDVSRHASWHANCRLGILVTVWLIDLTMDSYSRSSTNTCGSEYSSPFACFILGVVKAWKDSRNLSHFQSHDPTQQRRARTFASYYWLMRSSTPRRDPWGQRLSLQTLSCVVPTSTGNHRTLRVQVGLGIDQNHIAWFATKFFHRMTSFFGSHGGVAVVGSAAGFSTRVFRGISCCFCVTAGPLTLRTAISG